MGRHKSVKKGIAYLFDRLGYGIVRRLDRAALLYNDAQLRHFLCRKALFERIAHVDGDIVECGVGYGRSFFQLTFLACHEEKNRSVWGFDSFRGFPEPSVFDESPRCPVKGQWKVATPRQIRETLIRGGIPALFVKDNVRLVEGFFEKSLGNFRGQEVAFLHLDVDLYDSYKTTLQYFWPKVAKGGVILFDEYVQADSLRDFPGASRAIDEFFGETRAAIRHDEEAVTCPTDGGRGASLIDWAAIDMKGTFYGRQEYTIETLQ